MSNPLILTVVGPDHPGIVDKLSTVIEDNGGNWVESRMCNLAGQFAGVLLIKCPPGNCAKMQHALETLDVGGLEIHVSAGQNQDTDNPRENIELEISGPDHPGIVHDISHFLAERNINILELASHCEEGAMSGGYIFHSNIVASIPHNIEINAVESALDDLAGSLNVDITLDNLKGMRTRI